MRVIVTGGAGFIGQHTCRLLEAKGYDVLVLDKDKSRLDDLPCALNSPTDITDFDELEYDFDSFKPDAVIHLAAQSSVAVSMKNWVDDAENNIIGTLNVIKCCQLHDTHIIFASSGGCVYGDQSKLPIVEEARLNPRSPYAISKLAGEYYIQISGLRHTIFRYPNVYGPGQPSDGESGVIAIFAGRMLRNEECIIYGDGENSRDYVYVEDIALANIKALETKYYGVFNLGTGIEVSVNQIFHMLAQELDYTKKPVYVPKREGEVRRTCLDAMDAREYFGWKPRISLEEGIKIIAQGREEVSHQVHDLKVVGSNPTPATKGV